MCAVVTVREAVHVMAAPGSSTAAAGALILVFEMVQERVSLMSDGTDNSTFLNLSVPVLTAVSTKITVSPAVVSESGVAVKARSNTAVLSLSGTTALSARLEMAMYMVMGGWKGMAAVRPTLRVTLPASKSLVVRTLQQENPNFC